MEVEINPQSSPVDNSLGIIQNDTSVRNQNNEITFDTIAEYLINERNVHLKSQQRGESDVTTEEKREIIRNIYNKGATNFLIRFGKQLKSEHLQFFAQFENDSPESYEIKCLLRNLSHKANDRKNKRIKNRRYAALKHMVENDSYFSETEMMKRNPLLYEQLVGQYLTEDEKRERDLESGQKTLVGILLEGLERDEAETKRKTAEIAEVDALMEEDLSENEKETSIVSKLENTPSVSKSDSMKTDSQKPAKEKQTSSLWGEYTQQTVSSSPWGEFPTPISSSSFSSPSSSKKKQTNTSFPRNATITAPERRLLKEEFITTMYENFLEGKDEDFDYENVDENEEYDNLELVSRDEEEKYFDSEEPEDYEMNDEENKTIKGQNSEDESSEDELDVYMSALNQHPAVVSLSKDIERL